MFTSKQREAVTKAIEYLDMPDEVKNWLQEVEPKNHTDASHIVSLVFAIAYRKGDMISGLWGEKLNVKRDELCTELIDLCIEYETR